MDGRDEVGRLRAKEKKVLGSACLAGLAQQKTDEKQNMYGIRKTREIIYSDEAVRVYLHKSMLV